MASRRYFAVFLLFAVWICILLDLVLLANSPPDSPTLYYKESADGDFGVRMSFDPVKDKALNVIISYDTLTTSAADFFRNQISAKLIDDFTTCNVIAWNFSPCSTTKIVTGKTLACPKGVDQCRFDQIHGCLDDALNWHQDAMGKFVICVFTPGKICDDCNAQEGGLILTPADMKTCVACGNGAVSCNGSHNDFVNAKAKPKTQTEIDNSANLPNAITDFKKCICKILAQINRKCDVVCAGLY